MSTRQMKLYAKEASTGNTTTTTIGYINPTADGSTMKTFAQKLNAFSTNEYEKSDLVETTNLDTEAVKKKAELIIEDSTTTITVKDGASRAYFNVIKANPVSLFGTATRIEGSSGQWTFYPIRTLLEDGMKYFIETNLTGRYQVTVGTIPDSNFEPATKTVQVTVTA